MPSSKSNANQSTSAVQKKTDQKPVVVQLNPKPVVYNKKKNTKITAKFDAGFPNNLFIRGRGGDLSWDKGILLQNIKSDEWIWETDRPFTTCEFKILMNDEVYEVGENHVVQCGEQLFYTPRFNG